MNGSFAAIDPPFLKTGEIQATRPATSDVILALPLNDTPPVTSTVNACSVGAGLITATVGLAWSAVRSEIA